MGQASRRKWEARLQRMQVLLQEKTISVQPPIKVIRAAWITTLLGGGLAVITAFFWFGVSLTYLGAVILAIDCLCEKWSWKWKSVSMLLPAMIIVFVSIWAWGSAPLQIQMIRHYGNYKDGELIHGIPWHEKYSELQFVFTNTTDQDYEDFDMFVNTDLFIAKTGWISQPPTCVLRLPEPHVIEVRAKGMDKSGKPLEELFERGATTGPYLLHCDKLLKHDSIQFIFALVSGFNKERGKEPIKTLEGLFAPKKLPSWASVQGTYKSLFRPFSISEKKQLTGD
jgi:hypothetical protein